MKGKNAILLKDNEDSYVLVLVHRKMSMRNKNLGFS